MSSNNSIAKAPRIDMSEFGATGLDYQGGTIQEEFLGRLSGVQAQRAYREMASNDAIVGATLYAIEMLMRGITWTVEAGGPERAAQQRAEFLRTIPEDMSHTWPSFVGEWMAAPERGFAPFEIVWKRRAGAAREPGASSRHDDGLIGVRKLAIRHPDTLDRWVIDDAGGVQAMIQRGPPDWRPRTLPIEKLLLFTVLQRKGSPEGMSLLRRAYVAWYRKKRIEEIEAIGIERDLAGLPVFTAPPHWFASDASSEDAALLAEVKKIGRRLRTDEQACVVLPAMFDADGHPLMTFTLATSGGRRAIDTAATLAYYSRQITMTVLADVILLGHEKVGSFALASSKTNLFASGVGALADDIEATLNRHLVPRLMALNGWPTDATMPQFRHGDIESVDIAELGAFIQQTAGAGMQWFPSEDGAIEEELVRLTGLRSEYAPMEPSAVVGPLA